MSLIFGINLCDRLYISGDTRLAYKKDKCRVEKKDKILKIVPFTKNIVGAFAGDASMAAFVAKKLLDITNVNSIINIRELRKNIESILTPIIDDYWQTINSSTSIVIIFGGINCNERKQLDKKQIYDKIMSYSALKDRNQSMNLRPALFNVMTELRYPEPPDSHIFSVQISPPSRFIIEDAEWGEYLAYGPNGISKKSLDPSTFGMVEFSGNGNIDHDNMSISAILNQVIDITKEETIGRAFVNMIITENTIGILGGKVFRFNIENQQLDSLPEVFVENGIPMSRDEKGKKVKLTSIKDYSGFGNLEI